MEPINKILTRLDRVKNTGERRWMALCSAHADKTRSLSIKETADGRILMHCFAGCTPVEILSSIGISFNDLFPDGKPFADHRSGPTKESLEWANLIALVADYDNRKGVTHSAEDLQTIAKARAIFDEIPKPPRPTGKPKLAPFSKILHDRQRYRNLPFLVVVCAGVYAWDLAKRWSESSDDIVGLVAPDAYPEAYIWPVSGCAVMVERDSTPGDEVILNLVQSLLSAGAWRIVVMALGGEIERIYHGSKEVNDAAA